MGSSDDLHPTSSLEKNGRKKRGLRWFCVDLWWVHLIVLIVCTLCITLPLVYVAYPRIGQSNVNSSELEVTHMELTQPQPTGFHLNLTTELTVHTIFRPKLGSWNGSVWLAGANSSFMNVTVPAIKGKTGENATVDQQVSLSDAQLGPFQDFVSALIVNDTVTTHLIGRGALKLGALPTTHVNYNKTIVMKGFNGLNGISISDSKLLTTPQPDNATLAGKVTIPNNSGGIVELGNLTFGLSLPAFLLGTEFPTPLGYATVNNTILYPNATNTFDLRSVADQSLVLSAVSKNATLLKTGLPITIVTRSVEYNGQVIPWMTKALASQELQQILNITQILSGGA